MASVGRPQQKVMAQTNTRMTSNEVFPRRDRLDNTSKRTAPLGRIEPTRPHDNQGILGYLKSVFSTASRTLVVVVVGSNQETALVEVINRVRSFGTNVAISNFSPMSTDTDAFLKFAVNYCAAEKGDKVIVVTGRESVPDNLYTNQVLVNSDDINLDILNAEFELLFVGKDKHL